MQVRSSQRYGAGDRNTHSAGARLRRAELIALHRGCILLIWPCGALTQAALASGGLSTVGLDPGHLRRQSTAVPATRIVVRGERMRVLIAIVV